MFRRQGVAFLAFLLALGTPAFAQDFGIPQSQAKAPWGAVFNTVAAAEIVLGHVCLPAIAEHRSIPDLARIERLVAMPPRAAGASASDAVWRLASLSAVYAVAWTDGSCSTYVDRGPREELRAMADRVIRARPEGFTLQSSTLVDGRVERTVYCAGPAAARLVATITTPRERAPPGTRALSSTIYRAGPNGLCSEPAGTLAAQNSPARIGEPQLVRPAGVGGCIFRNLPDSVNRAALETIMAHGHLKSVLQGPLATVAPRCTGRPYSDSDAALIGSVFGLYSRTIAAYALGRQLQLPQARLDAVWSAATPAEKQPFVASARTVISPNGALSATNPDAVKPFAEHLALGGPSLDPDVLKLLYMYYSATAISEAAEADLAARPAAGSGP